MEQTNVDVCDQSYHRCKNERDFDTHLISSCQLRNWWQPTMTMATIEHTYWNLATYTELYPTIVRWMTPWQYLESNDTLTPLLRTYEPIVRTSLTIDNLTPLVYDNDLIVQTNSAASWRKRWLISLSLSLALSLPLALSLSLSLSLSSLSLSLSLSLLSRSLSWLRKFGIKPNNRNSKKPYSSANKPPLILISDGIWDYIQEMDLEFHNFNFWRVYTCGVQEKIRSIGVFYVSLIPEEKSALPQDSSRSIWRRPPSLSNISPANSKLQLYRYLLFVWLNIASYFQFDLNIFSFYI